MPGDESILLTIRGLLPSLTAGEKKIGDYVLRYPDEVVRLSITELAEACDVSDATIFRFCRKVGTEGYQDFKIALGSAHALARHLGPRLSMAHGQAVAEVLAAVVEFNVPAAAEKLSWVAEALGEDVRGLPPGPAAGKAALAVRRLCQDVGLGQGLGKLELRREDVAEIARLAAAGGANRGNPHPTSCADFVSLLGRAV